MNKNDNTVNVCPFCHINDNQIIYQDDLVMSIRDGYPLSVGHTLIIPKRHIASLFDATDEEQMALLQALRTLKIELTQQYAPDGYNIGINDGLAAGQTVLHLHIHLIPRYTGDCTDPRGGVRWIFPEKAVYWL
ncbi:HIT family hydrolase [Candidatus Thiomargarita nelsonii]|uniref:HIT family hydrolase n=1 Tax=Candidatus Thiomargarita nelsonii TaxID=1003181 RepID=A0A0A6PFY2_9GAMM|nr:HIT family hydrolase [Candidatus Thiomargarita nelsonii]